MPFEHPAAARVGRPAARRLVEFFLAPPAPAPQVVDGDLGAVWLPPAPAEHAPPGSREPGTSAGRTSGPRPSRIAVLGGSADVPAVAAAAANAARSRAGAVVWCWSPEPAGTDVDPPATPAARRLAAALAVEGHAAVPRGRLAWASLPADPAAAALCWHDATAPETAGHAAAAVLAVAGPRPAALEEALAGMDLLVLALPPDDEPLQRLARASLDGVRPPVVAVAPLTGATRLAALAGVGRLPVVGAELSPSAAERVAPT